MIGIAPPTHLLSTATSYIKDEKFDTSKILVLSQHVDCHDAGSTTGYVIAELLKNIGVAGCIVNHSEHRIKPSEIKCVIDKLSKLRLLSVLCVRNIREAKTYATQIRPDYVAIEPPELIGSGMAVSTHRPELISRAADAIRGSTSQLLCGAGIISGTDVAKAIELGSNGILVASGIIKKDTKWSSAISDLAKPLANY